MNNNELNETEKEELEYYRKKEELYKYAREFQIELAKDGFYDLAKIDDECCVMPLKCKECKSKHKIKADITFENAAEDFRTFYMFKKDRRKYVTAIKTAEEMYKELAFLNKIYIGKFDRNDAEYYRKVEGLEKYAKTFFAQIIHECFPLISKDVLPIKYHRFLKSWSEYSQKECFLGNFYKVGNQSIINIYEVDSLPLERIQQNIRHEIIHYCLNHSDLKYDDNSGVFHALCKIYDAGAYQEMNEREQHIFDMFLKAYGEWGAIEADSIKKGLSKNDYLKVLVMAAGNKIKTAV